MPTASTGAIARRPMVFFQFVIVALFSFDRSVVLIN
jgi:hypothetical protein